SPAPGVAEAPITATAGTAPTRTKPGFSSTEMPAGPLTERRTVYTPSSVYVWAGLRSVDVEPSPKSQDQAVGAGTVEVSVKWTVSGAWPEAMSAVKLAAPTKRTRRMLAPRSMGEL